MRNHYSRKRIIFASVMVIIWVMSWVNILAEKTWEPDVVYSMVNQHIEWEYAGKGGFQGRYD